MKLTVNGLAVSPVLGAVRLEKSREDAAASLTAVLWTAPADTYFQKLSLAVGDVVRLVDDPDVRDPIKFLREREIVHYQRFGDALRRTTERMDARNFYSCNPEFDPDCTVWRKK